MDVFGMLCEVGAPAFAREARDKTVIDAHRLGDGREVDGVASDQIDPQELTILQLGRLARLQRYRPIEAVRVVEARLDAALLLIAQRTTASKVTTAIAMVAVPYWRMFIATSARLELALATSSATPSTMGLIIDVRSSVWSRNVLRRRSHCRTATIPRTPEQIVAVSQMDCSALRSGRSRWR
jgi:hypothetical protein